MHMARTATKAISNMKDRKPGTHHISSASSNTVDIDNKIVRAPGKTSVVFMQNVDS